MKHEYSFEVRGYELDSFNHVNNAVYLNYIEEARWKFFKDTQWIDYMRNESLYPVVIETNIRYVNELDIFDEVTIESQWYHDGLYLIANQKIYIKEMNKKVAKATVKMALVSFERIVHEIPKFMKNKLDNKVIV